MQKPKALILRSLFLSLTLATLAACGGGGSADLAGGGDVVADPPLPAPPVPPPTEQPRFTGLPNHAPAELVFGQENFTVGAPNEGSGPGPTTLFDPAAVAVSAEGAMFIADPSNRRVLMFRQVPDRMFARADVALGQPSLFEGGDTGEPERFISPEFVSVGAGMLAVTDSAANRVLIYPTLPADDAARPTIVVGQANFDVLDPDCSQSRLNLPRAAYITPDGKLIVADGANSRVLIWAEVPRPDEPGKDANVVLGQPDGFEACAPNGGAGTVPARGTLRFPQAVWSDGTRLAVADTLNHRVLIWDQLTMQSGQEPDRVLGQPNFDSAAIVNPPDRHTLASPNAIAFDGRFFAVADGADNRVLLWDGWPSRDGQPADAVIGQVDFLHGTENDNDGDGDNDGHPSARTFSGPVGLTFHQNKLLVVDEGNNRLLIFKSE